MSFPSLQLTNAGRQLIIKALSEECSIIFTRFGVGKGNAPANVETLRNLVNPVKYVPITDITIGVGCANLAAMIDNTNLNDGFWWSELGIFAADPDNGDILYAYAHAGEYADYIPPYSSTSYLKTTINAMVVVGDAENVTATLGEYSGYVTIEDFEMHTGNTSNPHSVTKAQVGLGNVPNVTTNDQTPTFSQANALSNIESGEKVSTILGKIKKAIQSLINHINGTNPHNVTAAQVGAATSTHTHPDLKRQTVTVTPIAVSYNSDLTPNDYVKFTGNAYIIAASKIVYITGLIKVKIAINANVSQVILRLDDAEATAKTPLFAQGGYNIYVDSGYIYIKTDSQVPSGTEILIAGFYSCT